MKNFTCKRLFLLFCLLTTSWMSSVLAQMPIALSLEDCLQKAIVHSNEIAKSKLDKMALSYQRKQQKQVLLPQLNTYFDLSAAPILQTQFLNGTNLSPTDAAVPVQFGRTWNLQLGMTVEQLIFDESLRRTVPAAKLGEELANNAIIRSENAVIYQSTKLYFSILKSESLQATLQSNLDKLAQLEQSATLLFENDLGTSLDAKRLEVAQVNLRSKQKELAAAIAYQKDLLKAMCGIDMEEEIDVRAMDTPLFVQIPSPQLSPEERLLNGAMELTKTQMHASKATSFPKIGAYAAAGIQAPRDNLNFFELDSRWYGAMVLGLRAESPIFDGSRHKIRAMEVAMRKHEESLEQLRKIQFVERKHKQAQLESAQETLSVMERNVRLAEEIEEKMQLQYKEGYLALSEVLSAHTALVEAESNLKQQKIAVRMAELEVLKIMGQLDLLF